MKIGVDGTKSGKRGRGAAGKTLVVIAAQEDCEITGRIRLRRVVDASGKVSERLLKKQWNRELFSKLTHGTATTGWVRSDTRIKSSVEQQM